MVGYVPADGVIRRLLPPDAEDFTTHLKRLAPSDRRARFGGAVSDARVEQYAATAFAGDGLIFGYVHDGVLRAAAELRPLQPRWRASAEAAFSVEAPWQDRGIGTALFDRTVRAASNRGLTTLIVICLPGNARMQRIAARHGARLVWQEGDVVGRIEPPFATPWSLWRDVWDDCARLAGALFDAVGHSVAPESPRKVRRP